MALGEPVVEGLGGTLELRQEHGDGRMRGGAGVLAKRSIPPASLLRLCHFLRCVDKLFILSLPLVEGVYRFSL